MMDKSQQQRRFPGEMIKILNNAHLSQVPQHHKNVFNLLISFLLGGDRHSCICEVSTNFTGNVATGQSIPSRPHKQLDNQSGKQTVTMWGCNSQIMHSLPPKLLKLRTVFFSVKLAIAINGKCASSVEDAYYHLSLLDCNGEEKH